MPTQRIWRLASYGALLLAVAAVGMVFLDYGIAWDELPRNSAGQRVYNFYASLGRSVKPMLSKANTIHGTLFDVTAIALDKRLPLGLYETRHLLNALVGLLGVIGTWKLARVVAGERAAWMAGVLLFLTPSYFGHMFNNPKDIPLAAGSVWALYYTARLAESFPAVPWSLALRLSGVLALVAAVRLFGFALSFLLVLALTLTYLAAPRWFLPSSPGVALPPRRARVLAVLVCTFLIPYASVFLTWPWAMYDSPWFPLKALLSSRGFEWDGDVLLNGAWVPAVEAPWSYLVHYFLVKLPLLCLAALLLGLVVLARAIRCRKNAESVRVIPFLIVGLGVILPLVGAMILRPVLYDEVRHFLFVIPPLCVMAAVGLDQGIIWLRHRGNLYGRLAAGALAAALLISQVVTMIRLHPYQYIYYNPLAGGVRGAFGRYEMDYWLHSYKEAAAKLTEYAAKTYGQPPEAQPYKVYVQYHHGCAAYYLPDWFATAKHRSTADFHIASTRKGVPDNMEASPVAVVERLGVPLSLVYDLRAGRTKRE